MQMNYFRACRMLLCPTLMAISTTQYLAADPQLTQGPQRSQLSSFPSAQASGPVFTLPIEGTWVFSISRKAQGISFTALQSFTGGGVTLATGSLDRTPLPAISPLFGSWKQVGRNQYVATICFFTFDPSGAPLALIKTNETFRVLSDKTLEGSATSLACDVTNDNCVNVFSPTTIAGKRLPAEGASQ